MMPYQGVDLGEAFGGKTKERKLVNQMKSEFGLVDKSHRYLIHSIIEKVLQFAAQILACKIIRKCHADEVPTQVISLAAQCAKGLQYLCKEYLTNYR